MELISLCLVFYLQFIDIELISLCLVFYFQIIDIEKLISLCLVFYFLIIDIEELISLGLLFYFNHVKEVGTIFPQDVNYTKPFQFSCTQPAFKLNE